MIIGDIGIREAIKHGLIENSSEESIGPASYDLRLGDTFAVIRPQGSIALGDEVKYRYLHKPNGYMLAPNEFILATTMEKVQLPANMAAFVQGRSSVGRMGLQTENAGFVDPGFNGEITLELRNDSPNHILLKPGYRVAQLCFMSCSGVKKPYCGKYNGQKGATGSMIHTDAEGQKHVREKNSVEPKVQR